MVNIDVLQHTLFKTRSLPGLVKMAAAVRVPRLPGDQEVFPQAPGPVNTVYTTTQPSQALIQEVIAPRTVLTTTSLASRYLRHVLAAIDCGAAWAETSNFKTA